MKTKKIIFLAVLVSAMASLTLSCGSDDDSGSSADDSNDNVYNNKWIYSKMSRMYLWADKLTKSPNYNQEPDAFFESILYSTTTTDGDRFSYIEEDETKTKSTSDSYPITAGRGFDYIPAAYFKTKASGQSSTVGFFVNFVISGTSAADSGLKRGNIIYAIDGVEITFDNYISMYEKLGDISTIRLSVYNENGTQVTLPAIEREAYDDSPIFMEKVIESDGTKIGYLIYNQFVRESAEGTYNYDIAVAQAIERLNNQGISDLVLDLRYNPGGYVSSATYLASALVNGGRRNEIFATEEYNTHFQDSLINIFGSDVVNERFESKIYRTSQTIPQSNRNRIFILATENSASASELIINGLKPYMEVIHIGTTTVGKDKGSIEIADEDNDRIKWKLNPLVMRIKNANNVGNYINGLTPTYELDEWTYGYSHLQTTTGLLLPTAADWKGGFTELGDKSEPLLAKAIELITGEVTLKTKSTAAVGTVSATVPTVKRFKRPEMIVDADKFRQ